MKISATASMAVAMIPLPADRFFPREDAVVRFAVTVLALLPVVFLVAFFAGEAFDAVDFEEDFAPVLFFVVLAVDVLVDDERADDFEDDVFEVGAFADLDAAGLVFAFAPADDVAFAFFDVDFAAVDFLGVGISYSS